MDKVSTVSDDHIVAVDVEKDPEGREAEERLDCSGLRKIRGQHLLLEVDLLRELTEDEMTYGERGRVEHEGEPVTQYKLYAHG